MTTKTPEPDPVDPDPAATRQALDALIQKIQKDAVGDQVVTPVPPPEPDTKAAAAAPPPKYGTVIPFKSKDQTAAEYLEMLKAGELIKAQDAVSAATKATAAFLKPNVPDPLKAPGALRLRWRRLARVSVGGGNFTDAVGLQQSSIVTADLTTLMALTEKPQENAVIALAIPHGIGCVPILFCGYDFYWKGVLIGHDINGGFVKA